MITKAGSLAVRDALAQAHARSDALFGLVRPEALYERPVPVRHRLIFYLGHLEAFDWNLVNQVATVPSVHPELDRLFAFGIDPHPGQLPVDKRSDWPQLEEVRRYTTRTRRAADDLMIDAPGEIVSMALEHRLMHAETFAYLLHDLAITQKTIPPVAPLPSGPAPVPVTIEIPAGTVTLGQRRMHHPDQDQFGWDNEFDGQEVSVRGFAMTKYKITNGEYLAFVRAGADPPHFWTWHEGQWHWRGMSGNVPLPLDWPVYVTQREACDFAAWAGKRLPTEAEFHQAAYGTPHDEEERSYPWGNHEPDSRRGNFNGLRWDPVPVTATPLGDSAFGVSQLTGNGWEWTSTVFRPFPGFQSFTCYPGYSAPFFDGDHYVLKGASSRTDVRFLRRSFRNWFRADYPYAYAGFRCVED